jgi:hypothetical protein
MKDRVMAIIGIDGDDYLKAIRLLQDNNISYKHDLGFTFYTPKSENKGTREEVTDTISVNPLLSK